MSAEHVSRLLEGLLAELDAEDLEPNAMRTDWAEQRTRIEGVLTALEELSKEGDEVVRGFDSEEARARGREELALPALRASAMLFAAGRKGDARRILGATREELAGGDMLEEVERALADPTAFTRLCHAEWLLRHGRIEEARTLARALVDGPFEAAAKRILDAPRPLTSAPTLLTFNGFGLAMHGEREPWPDGSYVSTRFITALWIPLLPLDAFRVVRAEDGYWFRGKVPLGPLARWWQRLFLTAAVLIGLGVGGHRYWHSAAQRLKRAQAALEAEEKAAMDAHLREQLLQKHERLIEEHAGQVDAADLDRSSGAVARLALGSVKEPLGPEDVDDALRAVRRYAAIPLELRSGASASWTSDKIEGWVGTLGETEASRTSAALRLLELGSRALAPQAAARLEERRHRLDLRLADALAADWPLAAVRVCAKHANSPDAASCGARVDALGDDMSTLVELEQELRLFADKSRGLDPGRSDRVSERVERARKAYDEPARQQLLESEDEGKLRQALRDRPRDQDLVVLIAAIERGRGDFEGARKTLESLGPPGKLVWKAQHQLALVLGDLGDVERSGRLLERMLAQRLPDYEAATLEYSRAAAALETKLVQSAESDAPPPELASRIEAAGPDQVRQVFQEWLSQALSDDPELTKLRDKVARASDVVPTAIALGTLELRRASAAAGEERARRLAAAERAFLAISSGGEGIPSYHLGLGQVYHRLGKTEEAERELGALLQKNEPELSLEVARAYRGLGMESRTREICQSVHASADAQHKSEAATLLSLVAKEREERAHWLRQADAKDEFVQTSLLQIEAETAFEAGKLAEADAKYAESFRRHFKAAKHSSAGANNAALALGARYQCSGDRAHLDRAVELLESARALDAESALVLMNTASILEHRSFLKVLAGWMRLPVLKLAQSDAEFLIDAMLEGEHRERILAELRASPDVRKALELWREAEVLAPRRSEPYAGQLAWAERFEDTEALSKIEQRLRGATLDTLEASSARLSYVEGKRNDIVRRALDGELVRLERATRELDPAKDKPSLAAVRALESGVHTNRSLVDDDAVTPARRALEAFRDADRLWPAIGAKAGLDADLLRVALLAASKKAPGEFPNLGADLRNYGVSAYLFRALERDAKPLLEAVRGEPEWREVLELRKQLAPARPDALDWLLGKLAGDEELVAHGKRGATHVKLAVAQSAVMTKPGAGSEARLAFLRAVLK